RKIPRRKTRERREVTTAASCPRNTQKTRNVSGQKPLTTDKSFSRPFAFFAGLIHDSEQNPRRQHRQHFVQVSLDRDAVRARAREGRRRADWQRGVSVEGADRERARAKRRGCTPGPQRGDYARR